MIRKKLLPGLKKFFHSEFTIILVFIVLMLVVSALGGGWFLLSIDKHHAYYREIIIKYFLKGNNYYDGTEWFSVAATLIGGAIGAVPGLMCGVLALVQTQRLHKLEARYHRPALEIEKAVLCFAELDKIYEDGKPQLDGFNARQRLGVSEAKNSEFTWWIDFEANLILNNDIPVRRMEIKSVAFSFPEADPEKEYTLSLSAPDNRKAPIRSFQRMVRNGHAVYNLLYCLNPCVLKPVGQSGDFNESFDNFAYYSERRDSQFLAMDLTVLLDIVYEYMEGNEKCLLKIAFKADSDMDHAREASAEADINPNIIEKQSVDGYITYEV